MIFVYFLNSKKEEISGCCFQALSHKYYHSDALPNGWIDKLVIIFTLCSLFNIVF